MDVVSIATGGAGAGALYFVYLAARKGLPAALAWLRERWGRGRAALAQLEDDVGHLAGRLEEVENALVDLHRRLAAGGSAPGAAASLVPAAEERLPAFLQHKDPA